MARRGAFGRLPRAAPDLTNTLVALIREANAITDRNYLDAWQKGGKVEGKGVNDERLLKHFKKRRDALDPSDPLWDEWNNRVAQYDFAINESKMSLKFDQGKISEEAMSDFYGKWAGREDIQQNSEFYRHLLSQEAKWHSAAKAGRSARGASNKAAQHDAWVQQVLKTQVNAGDIANDAIFQIAKRFNALEDNATSLADTKENSDGWGKVMDIIDDGKSDNPEIQAMLDGAIKQIREFAGDDWEWSKSSVQGLLDKADRGYERLKANAMNKTEFNAWSDRKDKLKYEAQRIKAAKASLRVAEAADMWADSLDACQGNPYCAKKATQTYYDALQREGKYLIAGQGNVTIHNDDPQQSAMMVETLDTLRKVLDGKAVETPIKPTGAAGMIGPKPGDTDYKGADVVGPAASAEQIDIINRYFNSPQGTIATTGNVFNKQIDDLDKGGWLSVEADTDAAGNQRVDGDGNPLFKYITHPASEPPFPGMVKITGVTEFEDTSRPRPTMGGGLVAGPYHTVQPAQYARPEAPTVITKDAGGNIVAASEGTGLFGVVGGATGAQMTGGADVGAGYMVIRAIGPDGTGRVFYRTGTGTGMRTVRDPYTGLEKQVPTNEEQYIYTADPPVDRTDSTGKPIEYIKDPRTGVSAPILTATATPRLDSEGKQVGIDYIYDTKPINDGVSKARTTFDKTVKLPNGETQVVHGNLPLGSFQTHGATLIYQDINALFASGKPGAAQRAQAKLTKWTNSMYQLDPTDPDRNLALRDMAQLTQVVRLQNEGNFGSSYDDDYAALNNRTPKQVNREKELRAAGFGSKEFGGQPELDRRLKLLDRLEDAEDRILTGTAGMRERDELHDQSGLRRDLGRNPWAQTEAETAKARRDLLNPTISVSGIKIPGFDPLMMPGANRSGEMPQGLTGNEARAWWGAQLQGPVATPFPAPKPISTVPKSPTYKGEGGLPAGGFAPPGAAPTTVYKPPLSNVALSGAKTGTKPPKEDEYKAPKQETYLGQTPKTAPGGERYVWRKGADGVTRRVFV